MKKCSNCNIEYEVGMFSLISDMCDDCYEKINHYTPENNYVKHSIKREFQIPEGQYSPVDLLVFFSSCEKKIHNEIRQICIDKEKNFSVVFREFDIIDKINELAQTCNFKFECSFFFANTLLDTVSNFEDRNKYKTVFFR